MVMPIWDHNPFKWPKPPYVMWSLIVVNFAVFFLQVGAGPQEMAQTDRLAGLIPAAFTSGTGAAGVPAALTLITYQFLHANFMHVFGNMIFLFVFGDDIEELLGHWRFLAFYLACGVGAGLAFVMSAPGVPSLLIGASGSVAGVIAAYLMYRPCQKVTVLLGLIPLRLRAFWVIGGWADLASHRSCEPQPGRHRLLGPCRRSCHRRRAVPSAAPIGHPPVRVCATAASAIANRAVGLSRSPAAAGPATLTLRGHGH